MPGISFFGTHRNALGESPLWDAATRRLWWVDALAGEIHSADAGGGGHVAWSYPQPVGSIGLSTDGLVAAMADGFHAIDARSGEATAIRRVDGAGCRLNDGKADRHGRFFSAQMRMTETAAGGRLWRLDRDSGATPLIDGLAIGNAICFSPDGAILYVADSIDGILRAYSYDGATGTLGARRDLVDCRAHGSAPDGATVDALGRIWVALVLAQAVACYSPEGELLDRIELPIPYPSCPAFGGPDLATLYVTTIADSGHRLVTDHPDGGRILAIDGLDAVGLAEGRYTPDNHNRE